LILDSIILICPTIMAQQHGLGRGLSSLIPPKKEDQSAPFKDIVLRTMAAQGVDLSSARPVTESFPAADVPFAAKHFEDTSDLLQKVQPLDTAVKLSGPTEVSVSDIVPNPHQPRLHFDDTKLRELADSIREHGVLQSLVVSPKQDGTFELIAGERRLQASRLAGLKKVPVVIREAGEQEKLELAIIENIQRHDLNPIEESKAYARLIDEFGLTQEETAKKMGKSRSAVANAVRLLSLPIEIQRAVSEGRISEGHAKALLSLQNPEKQRALFEMIVKTNMTVREVEAKVRATQSQPYVRRASFLAPELAEKAERMSSVLGTKVAVKPVGRGGRIVVEYYSDEELDQIVSKILPE
jgi:ParB family transcriptional regulator, chromosome partitioning protein